MVLMSQIVVAAGVQGRHPPARRGALAGEFGLVWLGKSPTGLQQGCHCFALHPSANRHPFGCQSLATVQ